MANGLPDAPPIPHDEFLDSQDDITCPICEWDREQAAADPQAAFNQGILLAIEYAPSSPFSTMAGTQLSAYYWHCPKCKAYFTTEEDVALGSMA